MLKFPIDEHLNKILSTVDENRILLLRAEPGVGKTTRIPLYILKNTQSKILVIEPRRLAAKLPAEYISEQLGEGLGQTVGYKVRFEQKLSTKTRLLFMTDGMVVKHLSGSDFLEEFDYIIFDEFHERTLNADLAFALIEYYRESLCKEIKLVLMSATLNTLAIQKRFPNIPLIDIKGKNYEVEIRYQQPIKHEKLEEQISRAVASAIKIGGNVLVFLTGRLEISRVSRYLERRFSDDYDIIELMSHSSSVALRRIYQNDNRLKIICSTNVAETSVTLPNIKFVVDGGFHYQQIFASWNGLPFIRKVKICQDSALQRAGRAGRQSRGVCVRLYSESDFLARDQYISPAIMRSDLSSFLLDALLASGRNQVDDLLSDLSFLSAPPKEAVKASRDSLNLVGIVDSAGMVTDKIKMIKDFNSVHPRLSSMIVFADTMGMKTTAIILAGLLEEGSIIGPGKQAKHYHDSDFLFQVNFIKDYYKNPKAQPDLSSNILVSKVKSIIKFSKKLGADNFNEVISLREINRILLAGFPDRVARILPKFRAKQEQAQKKGEVYLGGQFMFTHGKSAVLSTDSPVQGQSLLISPLASESSQIGKKQINLGMVSAVEVEDLRRMGGDLLRTEQNIEQTNSNTFVRIREEYYGQILISREKANLARSDLRKAIKEHVMSTFPVGFEDSHYLDEYAHKLMAVKKTNLPNQLPDFVGDFVALVVDYICDEKTSLAEVYQRSLESYVEEVLSFEDSEFLRAVCPSEITLSNGVKMPVFWNREGTPELRGKIQVFYGIKEDILIGTQLLRPRCIMLAPNGRSVQVTEDLAGFFDLGYYTLLKHLKPRYPRHYWPADPKTAAPVLMRKNLEK